MEYVPTALRETASLPRKVAYGIGIEHVPGSFGMTHGPFSREADALDIVPADDAVLIRFNSDGTHDIEWRWAGDKWVTPNP